MSRTIGDANLETLTTKNSEQSSKKHQEALTFLVCSSLNEKSLTDIQMVAVACFNSMWCTA
jgi:tRNA A37 threonylcarbamoyladenosine modification protein TsaB